MARFVGKLDFAPLDPSNPTADRVLEHDFGFVRNDGIMVLLLAGCNVNGASIPEFLWPLMGHPLEDENAFWSTPHDGGYGGNAEIIDLNSAEVTPEFALSSWDTIHESCFIHHRMPRKWWDKTMREAMVVMRERWWKRSAVYRAVRLFGWRSYRK